MIRVSCGECGSRFRVKPEHAGRRTRCPKCGAALQIPEPPADDAPEQASAGPPAPAPVRAGAGRSVSRAARGRRALPRRAASPGRRTPSAGTRRREPPSRRDRGRGLDSAIIARVAAGLIVVGVAVAAYFMMGGTDHAAVFRQGIEAMSGGDLTTAIARFGAIPEGHNLYPEAQQKLAEARELAASEEVRFDTRKADNLWGVIERMRKSYVDGIGPTHPEYAPNCRYLLKRAREFVQTYPDDLRVAEAKGLFPYYSQVANLDDPPTVADVRAEVRMRTLTWNFTAALGAIDEFAGRTGDADVAEQMRVELRAAALKYWQQQKQRLLNDGSLTEGNENWRLVVSRAEAYLKKVEGLTGVSADAIELRAKGKAARAAGG